MVPCQRVHSDDSGFRRSWCIKFFDYVLDLVNPEFALMKKSRLSGAVQQGTEFGNKWTFNKGRKSMTNEEYKKLSVKEFTQAAGRYESNHAGIYEMCKKDYPDILEELEKEDFSDLLDAGCGPAPNPQAFFDSVKRCLRPGGRLILRDVTSDNKILLWLMDHIELPLANLCGHGDVKIATRETVTACCRKAGLKVEKFEIRKGMRMHCVVRKV